MLQMSWQNLCHMTTFERSTWTRGVDIITECMIRWLGRLGRCVGTNDHATKCSACFGCCGCVLGCSYIELQLYLHCHDYIAVVTCCNHSFSYPVRLPCVHRSCGEPRPTSVYQRGFTIAGLHLYGKGRDGVGFATTNCVMHMR